MREEVGGVDYDAEAQLAIRRAGTTRGAQPCPGIRRRARNCCCDSKAAATTARQTTNAGDSDLAELEETEKEARLVAHRLRELVAQGHKIWDEAKDAERAVEWRDMAVLLRAPANKAEAYAKEFERAGVPLVVERGGFYDSTRNCRFAEPAQAARQSVAGRSGHRRAALAAGRLVAG